MNASDRSIVTAPRLIKCHTVFENSAAPFSAWRIARLQHRARTKVNDGSAPGVSEGRNHFAAILSGRTLAGKKADLEVSLRRGKLTLKEACSERSLLSQKEAYLESAGKLSLES